MIKYIKYLFTLIVISLGIINFSNAWTYTGTTNGVQNNWLIYQPVGDIEYFQNVGFKLMNYGEFQSFYNTGNSYDLLYFPYNGDPYQYGNVYYGWINEKLYYYGDYHVSKRYKTQGFIQNFCKTTKENLFDVNGVYGGQCDYNLPAEEFYSQPHDFINIYSMAGNGSVNAFNTSTYRTFCLEETNGEDIYCWSCSMYDSVNNSWAMSCNSGLTGSLNFDIDVTDFSSVASIPWSFSPWGWSGPTNPDIEFNTGTDIGKIPADVDKFIDQYEKSWKFDKNMCFVGTDNLSGLYEDGISFTKGTGDTIFGLYHYLYNSFGSNIIHNVGTFINVWLINYSQWFDTNSEDRLYLASYNGPDTNISLIYTGFTFPFLGKSASIFFIADMLYNEYNMNEPTFGEDVAFYCYMKLNRDSIKNGTIDFTGVLDMVNPGIVGRIEDRIDSDLHSSPGFNIPDVSSGSIWDGIVNSGYNIPDDINPTNLFQDYYDKINNLIRNFSPVSTGVIPKWILFPMIFLILYRILKH